MALDMLPSFRFRWESKDLNGGHPLIAKLAEKVLDVNLHQVAPAGPSFLLPEQDWEGEHILSPKPAAKGQPGQSPTTPKVGPASQYGMQGPYGPPGAAVTKGSPGSHNGEPNGQQPKMPEIPPYYFYPFYADNPNTNGPQTNLPYNYQSSQDQFVLEEKDTPITPAVNTAMQMQQWNGVGVFVSFLGGAAAWSEQVINKFFWVLQQQQQQQVQQRPPPQFGPHPPAQQ